MADKNQAGKQIVRESQTIGNREAGRQINISNEGGRVRAVSDTLRPPQGPPKESRK